MKLQEETWTHASKENHVELPNSGVIGAKLKLGTLSVPSNCH